MKYLKKDLIELVSDDTGFYKKEVEEVLNSILHIIPKMLNEEGDRLLIHNFGNFKCVYTKERNGRNPKTNESILIPQQKRIKFKASEVMYNENKNDTVA